MIFFFSPAHVAFCGDLFELKFTLPFVDFLPETVTLKFLMLVSATLCMKLLSVYGPNKSLQLVCFFCNLCLNAMKYTFFLKSFYDDISGRDS